jgi:hypothetical protein
MNRSTSIYGLLMLAALAPAADPLDAIFSRIDATAKTFRGMTASISDTQHMEIVDDNTVQTGTIRLLRLKDETRIRVDVQGPGGGQSYALNGREGRNYNARTRILDIYDLANKQSLINQVLALGFGAASSELKSVYEVTYLGEETIGTQRTSRLKLVPKSSEMKHTLKQADLWYAENGLVAQQKFLYPSGDYRLVTYSGMKLGAVPEKEMELNPPGATKQNHGKIG